MNSLPVYFVLSFAIVSVMILFPPSAFSSIAVVGMGIALLYVRDRVLEDTAWSATEEEDSVGSAPDLPLDDQLVARIAEELKGEPSEQLWEIYALRGYRGGDWSLEAVEAARLLLEQRARSRAPESVYRSGPRPDRDHSTRA